MEKHDRVKNISHGRDNLHFSSALQKRDRKVGRPTKHVHDKCRRETLMRICPCAIQKATKGRIKYEFPRLVSLNRTRKKPPNYLHAVQFCDFYAHFCRIYWRANKFRGARERGVSAVSAEGVEIKHCVLSVQPGTESQVRYGGMHCRNLRECFFFTHRIS